MLLEKYAGKYGVIPNSHLLVSPETAEEADLFLSLDCGDLERLGAAKEIFLKTPMRINIDHHESNTGFGLLNYVDAGASSTSEIVYELIHEILPIGTEEAAGLYAGLVYDFIEETGNLHTPHAFQIIDDSVQFLVRSAACRNFRICNSGADDFSAEQQFRIFYRFPQYLRFRKAAGVKKLVVNRRKRDTAFHQFPGNLHRPRSSGAVPTAMMCARWHRNSAAAGM